KEPYEFTDVDRTVAAGLSISGKQWGRDNDTFGIAGVVNGISGVHQAFLNAGGLGILVGDGKLPNPGSEKIFETHYSFPVFSTKVTLDYQLIANPAYNATEAQFRCSVFACIRNTKHFRSRSRLNGPAIMPSTGTSRTSMSEKCRMVLPMASEARSATLRTVARL
ncbi:MAG: carbohydrate porin, partial [Bradyrhizobium sp.]